MFLTMYLFSHKSELNVKSIFCCLLVSSFFTFIRSSKENLPKSSLCINSGNATYTNAVGLFNLSDDTCRIFFKNQNDTDCGEKYFAGDVDAGNNFSRLSLLTYLFRDRNGNHIIPSFNLTFSHIKWVSMKMRFSEDAVSGVTNCRVLKMKPNVTPDFYIFYDCLWNDFSAQNKAYIFQYQITTLSGEKYLYKYFFKIPQADKMNEEKPTKIEDWEVFSVIDISGKASVLSLMVQAVPVKFNVTKYKIKVMKDNVTEEEHTEHHNPLVPMFKYSYSMNSKPGTYYFAVTFEHPECGQNCFVSKTPQIIIYDTPGRSTLEIIVGTVVLVAIGLTSYLLWLNRRKTTPPVPSLPPKFLLIYDPVSVEHLNSVVEVAKYFNENYHIQALIDVLDIPDSEFKDPCKWYLEAVNSADFVGIFLSPSYERDVKSSVYPNAHSIALALLHQKLCSMTKCKFFTVALPNCSCLSEGLFEVAKHLKRYTLPKDLRRMLKEIFKVVPPNNVGKNFKEALEKTATERDVLILKLDEEKAMDLDITPSSSSQSSPTLKRDNCCLAFSNSNPELEHICSNEHDISGRSTPDSLFDEPSY